MGDSAPGTHILLANLLSDEHSPADGRGRPPHQGTHIEARRGAPSIGLRHTVELEGYGYRWFLVGGLDYILRRSR